MRILSILPYSPPAVQHGGAERQMHSLHKGLVSKGVDVQVLADIAQVTSPYQKYEEISIWGVPFPTLTSNLWVPGNIQFWVNWHKMIKLVKERIAPIDLIQVTPFREPALFGHWLSNYFRVPWAARIACSGSYGDFGYISKNWRTKRLLPELVSSCSAVVTLDDETYREAIDHGVPRGKIKLIANGLVLERIPPMQEAQKFPDGGVILYLGRIAPQKRLMSLIKAYSICKHTATRNKNIILPGLELVGGGNVDSLKEIIDQLSLKEEVCLSGQHLHPERFLSNAVCLINPSESEGLPNAVLEACALGVPVILSDIPIHRKIARDVEMENFLFPVGDEKALSDKLLNFLTLSRDEVIRKRIRCAQYGQGFSNEIRNQAYLDLYRKILKEKKVRHEVDK